MASLLTSGGNSDESATNGTILDSSATLNLTLGSALVAVGKWEATNGATAAFQKSDGSNLFTMRPVKDHTNNDLHTQVGYILSHGMSGATTIRMLLDNARNFRQFVVLEFGYTGVASFDNDVTKIESAVVGIDSGNILVNALSDILVGHYGNYDSQNPTTFKINAIAADGSLVCPGGGHTVAWWKLNAGGFTGSASAANLGVAQDHLTGLFGLKITPAGDTLAMQGMV